MDLNNIDVSKFNINNRAVYIQTLWIRNDVILKIKMYDGEKVFSGIFTKKDAEDYREQTVEDEAEYLENLKTSLTNGNENKFKYDIVEDDNGDAATFTWKKSFEGVSLIHGSVRLQRKNELKETLVDLLLEQNRDLRKAADECIKNSESLNHIIVKCKQDLENSIQIKSALESTLYSKFVQILNAKKRRIQLIAPPDSEL